MSQSTPRHAADEPRPRVLEWLTPDVRRWAYAVTTAAVPLMVAYGVLSETTAPLWVSLAASVLATSTAWAHTPAGSTE